MTDDFSSGPPGYPYRVACTDRDGALRLILQGIFMGLAEVVQLEKN